MATDLEKLVVSLEANLKQYEKELARAQKVTVSQLRAVEREAQKSTTSLEKRFGAMGLSIRSALVGAFAGLSVAAVTAVFRSAIDHMDELSKASQKIGIPVEELSKLEYAGKLADVALNDLQTSMARFSKSLAEIQGGTKNSAGEALKAMGVAATDANGALRPTPDLLASIADKFAFYQDGANKTALAIALFGKSGAELIPLLNGGAAGLKAAGDEAQRLGLVIDTQTAKAAEQLNDNFTRLTSAGQGFVDKVIASVLPAITDLSDKFVELLTSADSAQWTSAAINEFFNLVAEEARATSAEVAKFSAIAQAAIDIWNNPQGPSAAIARWKQAGAEIQKINDGLKGPNVSQFDLLTSKPGQVSAGGKGDLPAGVSTETKPLKVAPVIVDTTASDAAAKRAAREFESEQKRKAEAIQRVTDALQLENANLHTNELQQRINTELAKAGVSATSEQGKAIADLVTKNYNLEASQRLAAQSTSDLADRMREIHDAEMALAEMGVDAFERIAFGGEKAKDVMLDLAKSIAKAAFDAALLGSGPLAGLFGGSSGGGLIGSLISGLSGGSSFAGLYADGGQIPSGKIGIAGEAGPEWIKGPATVVPMGKATASGPAKVEIHQHINGAAGNIEVARIAREATREGLREYERQRPLADVERRLRVQ